MCSGVCVYGAYTSVERVECCNIVVIPTTPVEELLVGDHRRHDHVLQVEHLVVLVLVWVVVVAAAAAAAVVVVGGGGGGLGRS